MSYYVTVEEKTPDHPFYGTGSDLAFFINGKEFTTLTLRKGQKYKFILENTGHPFYFTRSQKGGIGAPAPLSDPVEDMTVTYTVRSDVPDRFYYECALHDYMGGHVRIV